MKTLKDKIEYYLKRRRYDSVWGLNIGGEAKSLTNFINKILSEDRKKRGKK